MLRFDQAKNSQKTKWNRFLSFMRNMTIELSRQWHQLFVFGSIFQINPLKLGPLAQRDTLSIIK